MNALYMSDVSYTRIGYDFASLASKMYKAVTSWKLSVCGLENKSHSVLKAYSMYNVHFVLIHL